MTVGYDVSWMNVANRSGGIFQYALMLISAIVEHTDITVVAVIGPTGIGIFDHLTERDNFRLVLMDSSSSFSEIIRAEMIDVVHTPMQWHYNCTLSVPMISTLHDLQPFHYPEFFSEEEIRFRETHYRKSAEFSEKIIVSFQHVKDDILEFFGIPPGKIEVCPIGMPPPKEVDRSRFSEVRDKYRLTGAYLLYPANTWRHKNHAGLLKALRTLHDKYMIRISLVCTGYTYDDYFPEIQRLIDELDLKDYVNFSGYIPEEELLLLLANATLVVIPTLYEAGSFPLMEAMTQGVPVICSNVTSLPDTIGDLRFTFDPHNADEMAEKIAVMLTDDNLLSENKANSQKKVAESRWDKVITTFVETYAKAIDQFKHKKQSPYYISWLLNFDFLENERSAKLRGNLEVCEADRVARLEVIQRQEKEFIERIKECEADRVARLEVIQRQEKEFIERIKECEADRAARLETLNTLSAQLLECEADREARLEVIHRQEKEFIERIKECEADRAARLEVIHEQGRRLAAIETEQNRLLGELEAAQKELEVLKSSLSWKITAPFRWIFKSREAS